MDKLVEILGKAADAQDAHDAEREGDVQYLLVDLPPRLPATGFDLSIRGVDTETPTVVIDGRNYAGVFEEDASSTLMFDKARLKRIADAAADSSEPAGAAADRAELPDPLVCVTSKRLRLSHAETDDARASAQQPGGGARGEGMGLSGAAANDGSGGRGPSNAQT